LKVSNTRVGDVDALAVKADRVAVDLRQGAEENRKNAVHNTIGRGGKLREQGVSAQWRIDRCEYPLLHRAPGRHQCRITIVSRWGKRPLSVSSLSVQPRSAEYRLVHRSFGGIALNPKMRLLTCCQHPFDKVASRGSGGG